MKLFEKAKSNSETLLALVALLVTGVIGFSLGMSAKIDKTATEALGEKGKELESIIAEISSQQDVLDELTEYKGQRESKQAEIKELDEKITTLKSEVTSKQAELDRLTGAIYTVKSEKVLSAGKYLVGRDIAPGLYDVKLVSGSGNFFSRGTNYVNEIFGSRSEYRHIPEYNNLSLETGDEIEICSNLKVKFILKQTE